MKRRNGAKNFILLELIEEFWKAFRFEEYSVKQAEEGKLKL